MSNYPTEADLKNVLETDASKIAAKYDLANLKAEIDDLVIDNLAPVPVVQSKLCDVVRSDVVKKTVFDKLVTKVNNINTSGFVFKNKYDTDKSKFEKKFLMLVDCLKN